jgi:hypothetical protein
MILSNWQDGPFGDLAESITNNWYNAVKCGYLDMAINYTIHTALVGVTKDIQATAESRIAAVTQ